VSEAVSYFFMSWTSPYLLFLTAAGTFAGIYIGAIPGLSVTMAVSILISFTFKWHVNEALALIAGIYLGGVYGGARSAILLNIPGAPAAIATALDGYPLAKRGEAGHAIGLTTVVSVFGGFIGIAALAVGAPLLSDLALLFAPRDYLLLAIWGILLVGSLSGHSLAKGVFAGALGVLIGMVGLDPMTAEGRFTYGSVQLTSGIPYVAAMIGFFGVSEVLVQLHQLHAIPVKQDVQSEIAITNSNRRQVSHPDPQFVPRLLPAPVIRRRPRDLDQPARTPHRELVRGPDILNQGPLACRPYTFFCSTSWRMCLSSARSATSFFNFRFSSSSCRKRRSSATPIPSYLRFQR